MYQLDQPMNEYLLVLIEPDWIIFEEILSKGKDKYDIIWVHSKVNPWIITNKHYLFLIDNFIEIFIFSIIIIFYIPMQFVFLDL